MKASIHKPPLQKQHLNKCLNSFGQILICMSWKVAKLFQTNGSRGLEDVAVHSEKAIASKRSSSPRKKLHLGRNLFTGIWSSWLEQYSNQKGHSQLPSLHYKNTVLQLKTIIFMAQLISLTHINLAKSSAITWSRPWSSSRGSNSSCYLTSITTQTTKAGETTNTNSTT